MRTRERPDIIERAIQLFESGEYVQHRVALKLADEFQINWRTAYKYTRRALTKLEAADQANRAKRFLVLDRQLERQIERIRSEKTVNMVALNQVLALRLKLYGFDKNETKIIDNSVTHIRGMSPEAKKKMLAELLTKAGISATGSHGAKPPEPDQG